MFKTMIGLSALALAAGPASAAISTYGDRAGFDAAAGSTTTETFSGCGTDTVNLDIDFTLSASSLGPCSSLAAGISFTPDANNDLYIAGPGQSANTSTALGVNFPNGGNNRVGFDSGSFAFGADFNQNFGGGSQSGQPATFTIDVLDMGGGLLGSYQFLVASGAATFFGVVSDTAMGGVWVRQAGGYAVMDNVSFGEGGPGGIPEPATWAMMILGFGLVGFAARRRTAAPAA
jgi:hypothetical protein